MTTETKTTVKRDVTETYNFRGDRFYGETSIRFFREKRRGKFGQEGNGRYVVSVHHACDEPEYKFFETIEEAREYWPVARKELKDRGYVFHSRKVITG